MDQFLAIANTLSIALHVDVLVLLVILALVPSLLHYTQPQTFCLLGQELEEVRS
ncbi:hypothetical protein [Nostoc sp. UHCC 0251]|uniref:hypothetical protein n=1 Tax=Nostoc sp. UHCC 0251 TaxID=3110240 RepID=UPI002B1FD549|nr:hypothetical protein [Nostoc sp. UHCC 0251]MEA5627433.1 hypothetical protein [Nostoc sp. UHCC 0251]